MSLHQVLRLLLNWFLVAQFPPRSRLSDQRSRLVSGPDGGRERAAERARFDVYRMVPFMLLFAWVVFDQLARPSF